MRLNITIDDDAATAVSERAEVEGVTRVEWIRRAVSAALCTGLYRIGTPDVPAGVLPRVEAVPVPCPDVPDRAEEIAALEEKIRTLEIVTAERDQLAGGIEAFQKKIQILEGEVRAAELKAALMAKDLEMSEGRHQSLLEVKSQLEERVVDLRATVGLMEGQIASLTTMMNRALPEVVQTRPWWKRIFG